MGEESYKEQSVDASQLPPYWLSSRYCVSYDSWEGGGISQSRVPPYNDGNETHWTEFSFPQGWSSFGIQTVRSSSVTIEKIPVTTYQIRSRTAGGNISVNSSYTTQLQLFWSANWRLHLRPEKTTFTIATGTNLTRGLRPIVCLNLEKVSIELSGSGTSREPIHAN